MQLEEYLKTNPKSQLIFDFDKTLVSLHLPWEIFIETVRDKLEEFDLKNNQIKQLDANQISYELINTYSQSYGSIVREQINLWIEQFETDFLTGYSINQPLLNFIKNNQTNYTFHTWSSNAKKTINNILAEQKLAVSFQTIISMNDVTRFKPNPEGFYKINSNNLTLDKYLMIGDSENDAKAASYANISFFDAKKLWSA